MFLLSSTLHPLTWPGLPDVLTSPSTSQHPVAALTQGREPAVVSSPAGCKAAWRRGLSDLLRSLSTLDSFGSKCVTTYIQHNTHILSNLYLLNTIIQLHTWEISKLVNCQPDRLKWQGIVNSLIIGQLKPSYIAGRSINWQHWLSNHKYTLWARNPILGTSPRKWQECS